MDIASLEKNLDSKGMRFILEEFPEQCRKGLGIGEKFDSGFLEGKKISSILVQGMGGSGITGLVLSDLLREELKIPLILNSSYKLPAFVNEETLFIAVSYSGNTEETLAGLNEAKKRNALIVGIGSNGALEKECNNFILIPKGLPPRTATAYLAVPLLVLLEKLGLAAGKKRELTEAVDFLETEKEGLKKTAAETAKELHKSVPVVCTTDSVHSAGIKWKTDLNENSKVFAHYAVLPEANHNEIVGFESLENGVWVFLAGGEGNERMKKRVQITKELVEKKLPVIEVPARGPNKTAKLFYLIYLGGFTSYYLALLRGTDPWPVENIDFLKKKLGE